MFINKGFSVLAYANGFTLWHYANTDDDLKTILQAGYFNNIKTLCNCGDIFIINAADGTAIKTITEITKNDVILDALK